MADAKKVLIIDDDPDAIFITKAMLSDIEGLSIDSATSANDGLEKVRNDKPDLICLDLQMPGRDGFSALVELRSVESTKDIPVIMLTGVAEQTGIAVESKDVERVTGHKPDAYVEKPVESAVLIQVAKDLLKV